MIDRMIAMANRELARTIWRCAHLTGRFRLDELRRLGATVATVLCVIDRGPQPNALLRDAGLELRALFREDDLLAAASS